MGDPVQTFDVLPAPAPPLTPTFDVLDVELPVTDDLVGDAEPVNVLPPDPNDTDLPHADLDTRSPESVLRTRGNIISDGPGTVGF